MKQLSKAIFMEAKIQLSYISTFLGKVRHVRYTKVLKYVSFKYDPIRCTLHGIVIIAASASAENSELSRQLHSSVRTANLETSLRLLSQGADPNYFHPEKNSTPLQVAGA